MSNVISFIDYKQSLVTSKPTPYDVALNLMPLMPHGVSHTVIERSVRLHQAKCDNCDENSWLDLAECYFGVPCTVKYEVDLSDQAANNSMPIMIVLMIAEFAGITLPITLPVHRLAEDWERDDAVMYSYVDEDDMVTELMHVDTTRLRQADQELTIELQTGCLTTEQRDICESFGVENPDRMVTNQPAYFVELKELVRTKLG
jgi:hypothetical protein